MGRCLRCPATTNLLSYRVMNRSFGSIFDGDSFEIDLCQSCQSDLEVKSEWFDPEHQPDKAFYENESKIEEIIEKLRQKEQRLIKASNQFEKRTNEILKAING